MLFPPGATSTSGAVRDLGWARGLRGVKPHAAERSRRGDAFLEPCVSYLQRGAGFLGSGGKLTGKNPDWLALPPGYPRAQLC